MRNVPFSRSALAAIVAKRRNPFLDAANWTVPQPDLSVELHSFELFLPNPKPHIRWHDEWDMTARALYPCAVCGARTAATCVWARLACEPSWCSHAARRALVDESRDVDAMHLDSWSFLSADDLAVWSKTARGRRRA